MGCGAWTGPLLDPLPWAGWVLRIRGGLVLRLFTSMGENTGAGSHQLMSPGGVLRGDAFTLPYTPDPDGEGPLVVFDPSAERNLLLRGPRSHEVAVSVMVQAVQAGMRVRYFVDEDVAGQYAELGAYPGAFALPTREALGLTVLRSVHDPDPATDTLIGVGVGGAGLDVGMQETLMKVLSRTTRRGASLLVAGDVPDVAAHYQVLGGLYTGVETGPDGGGALVRRRGEGGFRQVWDV